MTCFCPSSVAAVSSSESEESPTRKNRNDGVMYPVLQPSVQPPIQLKSMSFPIETDADLRLTSSEECQQVPARTAVLFGGDALMGRLQRIITFVVCISLW